VRFLDLVSQISQIDTTARAAAGHRLQQILTLRNWLIGAYIVEFEQGGEDRATYEQRLIRRLAEELRKAGYQALSARNLGYLRQEALAYPKLNPSELSRRIGFSDAQILQAPAQLALPIPFPRLESPAPVEEFQWRDTDWLSRLLTTLTFTHLIELARIEDPVRRALRSTSLPEGSLLPSRASHGGTARELAP
jgi:hypothetical protein